MGNFNDDKPPVVELKPRGVGVNGNLRPQPAPQWQPGQSGNPHGKHSRTKLSKRFLQDLTETFEQHGKRALEICATEDPTQFVRIVASILPREINLDVNLDATRLLPPVGEFTPRASCMTLQIASDAASNIRPHSNFYCYVAGVYVVDFGVP